MKFIVLQRDDIENFIHIEHAQVHDLINEDHHNELAHILDYAKHGEQLQFIKKSSTLLPKGLRLLYVPPLEALGITTGETSVTLYIIQDEEPLKLRITNPKAVVYYKTIG